MQLTDHDIVIRPAKADDLEVAVTLIMMAAESLLVNIFGGGDRAQTEAFLKNAWKIQHGQFGFGQHTVVCVNQTVVGICTHWQKNMPEMFAKHTAQSIVQFYTAEQAQQVIERSKAATYAILIPPEEAMIIGHVAVLPDYRRYGLAQKLVTFIANKSKQEGKSILALDVEEGNLPAISFYQKVGFCKDEKGPDRSPFIHMTKAL